MSQIMLYNFPHKPIIFKDLNRCISMTKETWKTCRYIFVAKNSSQGEKRKDIKGKSEDEYIDDWNGQHLQKIVI